MLTREQYEKYINRLAKEKETYIPHWSEPVYTCSKCGCGMRKNLWTCVSLTCNPQITKYEYRCDNEKCNNIEYLRS